MNSLFSTLLQLLRLRAGPQDLPSSWTVATGLLALYVALGMYSGQALGVGNAVARSLAINVLQVVAVAVMLRLRGFPERLPQTISALAGTGVLLGLLAHVLLLQANPEVNQPLLGLGWFAVFIWSLVVDAHIYRNALAVSLSVGVLIAVLLMAVSYVFAEAAF